MNARQTIPSRWLYLLAAAVAIAGVLVFTVLLVLPFTGMQRVAMPGTQQLTFTQAGTYTVIYEYQGTLNGVRYRAPQGYPNLRISVADAATGQAVALTDVSSSVGRYTLGSRSGYSAARFTVDAPGTYAVTAGYPPGQTGAAFALGLVRSPLANLLADILVGVATLVVTLTAAALTTIIVFFKRQAAGPMRPAMQPTPGA